MVDGEAIRSPIHVAWPWFLATCDIVHSLAERESFFLRFKRFSPLNATIMPCNIDIDSFSLFVVNEYHAVRIPKSLNP